MQEATKCKNMKRRKILETQKVVGVDMLKAYKTGMSSFVPTSDHAKPFIRMGPFSEKEKAIVHKAVEEFIKTEFGCTYEEGISALFDKENKRKRYFDAISEHIPNRSRKSIYLYILRHFRPGFKKGRWTEDEEKLLIKLQKKYGNQYKKMSPILERSPECICLKWRELEPKILRQNMGIAKGERKKNKITLNTLATTQNNFEDKSQNFSIIEDVEKIEDKELRHDGSTDKSIIKRPRDKSYQFTSDDEKVINDFILKETGQKHAYYGIRWSILRKNYFPFVSTSKIRLHYYFKMFPELLLQSLDSNCPLDLLRRHALRHIKRAAKYTDDISNIDFRFVMPFVPSVIFKRLIIKALKDIDHKYKEKLLYNKVKHLCKVFEVRKYENDDAYKILKFYFNEEFEISNENNLKNKLKEKYRFLITKFKENLKGIKTKKKPHLSDDNKVDYLTNELISESSTNNNYYTNTNTKNVGINKYTENLSVLESNVSQSSAIDADKNNFNQRKNTKRNGKHNKVTILNFQSNGQGSKKSQGEVFRQPLNDRNIRAFEDIMMLSSQNLLKANCSKKNSKSKSKKTTQLNGTN